MIKRFKGLIRLLVVSMSGGWGFTRLDKAEIIFLGTVIVLTIVWLVFFSLVSYFLALLIYTGLFSIIAGFIDKVKENRTGKQLN